MQDLIRPKILYIDDTPTARLLVRRLLSPHYDVVEADDGLKGIDLAHQIRPDLILVDLHMPHLDGYEVATRIKSLTPTVPIIALTADVTPYVRERVLASGCDGYLAKPIEPDTFVDKIHAFLSGAREQLQDDRFRLEYQQRLVARLEEKVRELTHALQDNAQLYEQNLDLLHQAQRLARLLQVSARISRNITSILDLDALLAATVDTLCDEFGFDFAAVFLLDSEQRHAILRAGRGEVGRQLLAQSFHLSLDSSSLVGIAILQRQARLAEPESFAGDSFPLPGMRSEAALPLQAGANVIGALDVQSAQANAFTQDDLTALQTLADQLTVAIQNALLLRRFEETHRELVRTKTYEAIATATGEAIHWVGNKAAPVPGSVARIRQDLTRYWAIIAATLAAAPPDWPQQPLTAVLGQAVQDLVGLGVDLPTAQAEMSAWTPKQLRRMLSIESIFEDLQIIEGSARAILNIKEDLIGPARQRKVEQVDIPGLLIEITTSMGIPKDIVRAVFVGDDLAVQADRVQLGRVFINLIKNAMEAMHRVGDKTLLLWVRRSEDNAWVIVDVTDNGEGIPPEQMEKIWMAFYTTKGDRGGTGLGLPACAQIIGELGGKITVESDVGLGTTFSVSLPVSTDTSA